MTKLNINKKNPLDEILTELREKGSLPALNKNVREIMQLTADSDTCAADLTSVILRDCGLTSSLLAATNSVYYAPKQPVRTVSAAVIFLGFERIRNLAIGLSLFQDNFKTANNRKLIKLYAVSYFSGMLSMALAHKLKYSAPEEIFVAGLLYRLPRLALAYTFPTKVSLMEDLIRKKNLSLNRACSLIFNVTYEDICRGIRELYNLSGKTGELLETDENSQDPLLQIIRQACDTSEILVGDKPGGQKNIEHIEKHLKKIINDDSFRLLDFVKTICKQDKNVLRFFKLTPDDIEIMLEIVKWGKASPAEIIPKLALGDVLLKDTEEGEEAESAPVPENIIGHFLTELSICKRKCKDINQTLMIAQEALFRCILNSDVFTVFLDKSHKNLVGKFYSGSNLLIKAEDFKVALSERNSMIVKSLAQKSCIAFWNMGDKESLGLPINFLQKLQCLHGLFVPIYVSNQPIGGYFLSRRTNIPFSEREQTWIEEIVSHVEAVFESLKNNKKTK